MSPTKIAISPEEVDILIEAQITLCNVCGYDIDGDDPAFACHCSSDDDCPNDIDLGVGSEHPER